VVSRLGRFRAAARELAERGRDLPAARRLRFALTIEALERFADGRSLNVLDAGCGEGLLAESVARRHPDWTVVAADVNDDQLERGRRRAEQAGLSNLRFVHGDLTGDLGDRAYDAVLAIECLVEIPDDDTALARMARALHPAGVFLAHVPESDWRPLLPGSEDTWRFEVRHGYRPAEFAAKLERAGLTPNTISPTTRAGVRLAQEIRDRNKNRSLKLQVLAYPPSVAAVRLERCGLRWGHARAFFVEARRS
jgi:SAM-dependent methyltransferase